MPARSHLAETKSEAGETISCRDSALKPQLVHWLVSRRPGWYRASELAPAGACVRAENERAPGYTVVVIDTKARVARRTAIVSGSRGKRGIENNCASRDAMTQIRNATDGCENDSARNLRSNVIAEIAPRLISRPDFYRWCINYCCFRQNHRRYPVDNSDLQFRLVILHAFIRALVHERANVEKYLPIGKRSENVPERIISFSVRNSYERQRLHDSIMGRSSAWESSLASWRKRHESIIYSARTKGEFLKIRNDFLVRTNPFNDRVVNDPSAKRPDSRTAREESNGDTGTMLNRGLIYGRGRRQRCPGGRKFLFECADRQHADKHGNAEVHRCASSNTEVKSAWKPQGFYLTKEHNLSAGIARNRIFRNRFFFTVAPDNY